MTTIDARKALEIIRDVAYTTSLTHRAEGRHALADKIDAALAALLLPTAEALKPEGGRLYLRNPDGSFQLPIPLDTWIKDRAENCERIAKAKPIGDDRNGWLEDAAYFRAVVDVLRPSPVLAETVRYEIIDQTGCLHVTSDPVHAEKLRQALMAPVLADEGVIERLRERVTLAERAHAQGINVDTALLKDLLAALAPAVTP